MIPPCAAFGHRFAKFRAAEFGHPAYEIAQHIGQILVYIGLKQLPCKFGIRGFRRIAQQPPAPVVGGQYLKCLIHEHAAPARGGELTAVIIEIVERFYIIHQLPRLARAQDRGRKRQGVKRHIVLAHELGIGHILGAFIRAPPAFPILACSRIYPFLRAGDIFDRGIEPDIEHFAFHAGPVLIAVLNRNAPVQIAGNAAVLQPIAIIEPFLCNRGGQYWPVGFAVDPVLQLAAHLALSQIKMFGIALLEIGRARNRRARIDQIGRIKLLGAIVALIAARAFKAAIGAGAFDIAVWQIAPVSGGIHLGFAHFTDQSGGGQTTCKMLR